MFVIPLASLVLALAADGQKKASGRDRYLARALEISEMIDEFLEKLTGDEADAMLSEIQDILDSDEIHDPDPGPFTEDERRHIANLVTDLYVVMHQPPTRIRKARDQWIEAAKMAATGTWEATASVTNPGSGGKLEAKLIDGPHAGTTWGVYDDETYDVWHTEEARVRYCPDDQFVHIVDGIPTVKVTIWTPPLTSGLTDVEIVVHPDNGSALVKRPGAPEAFFELFDSLEDAIEELDVPRSEFTRREESAKEYLPIFRTLSP
jgi:hypothetical protein